MTYIYHQTLQHSFCAVHPKSLQSPLHVAPFFSCFECFKAMLVRPSITDECHSDMWLPMMQETWGEQARHTLDVVLPA